MADPSNTWTRSWIVVLEVTADVPIGNFPQWWEVLNLPAPWEWDVKVPDNVHVKEVLGKELMS